MSSYSVKMKRGAVHIDGLDTLTTGGGNDMGTHISHYSKTACPSLSKSVYWDVRGTFATVAEALEKAEKCGTVCKSCRKAAEAQIASLEAQPATAAAAPAVAVEEVAPVVEVEVPAGEAGNREEWLQRAVTALRPKFEQAGAPLPTEVQVSCGFPGGGSPRKRIGECWSSRSSAGVNNIFISPVLDDPMDVLATLAHELVHAYDDCKSGHKGAFSRIAKGIGLAGKMTATVAGPELAVELRGIAEKLGAYPHKRVTLGTKKVQSTRMILVKCTDSSCDCGGYSVRTTAKWLDMGNPSCPKGSEMVQV